MAMNKCDIQILYEYDRWANNRVLMAVSVLRAEQFTRDLGGSFPSVRDTLVHILGGEWIWLTYWTASSHTPEFSADLRARAKALFSPSEFPSVDSVKSKWVEIEAQQTGFVNGLADESLAKAIPFRGTEVMLAHLMQHLVNHSSYHRGQVALMLRQLGAEPAPTDFHVFLEERQRLAAAGT